MDDSRTETECPMCQKVIQDEHDGYNLEETSLACARCNQWVHAFCLIDSLPKLERSIAREVLNCFTNKHVSVYCPTCVPKIESSMSLHNKMDGLAVKLDSLLAARDSHSPEPTAAPALPVCPASFAAVASKRVTDHARIVFSAPNKVPTVADLHAISEEEKHRRAIVVSGLAEQGNDFENVQKLVNVLDKSARVVDAFRMGLIDTKKQGPRLLKVVFSSSSVAKSVLFEARKLRHSKDFSTVFLRPSMPDDQRKYLGKLRESVKQLNNARTGQVIKDKYVIVRDTILHYVNCNIGPNGVLGRGVIDNNFSFVLGDSSKKVGKDRVAEATGHQ